jgi:ribosome biogenesis protein ERB1
LVKKLLAGNQQNSTIAIHPYGDNLIVGSNDHKVCWFDLDMGKTPFKKMSYHKNGVRRVTFHKSYPLFASCSDDGNLMFYS